jgi:hypothetical protein
MLLQESRNRSYVNDFVRVQPDNFSMIAYRSRSTSTPTDAALQQLLRVSQTRNKRLGLTGVLLYENGHFFQWLEGPTDSLRCVWDCILRDLRHHHITVLREEPISERVFEGWDLRIARGTKITIDAMVTAMESSNAHLKRVTGTPKSVHELSLGEVFATIVIPRLMEVHGRFARDVRPFKSTASIWHADADCGEKLAGVLMSARQTETSGFVDSLLEQGAGFNALYREVFEPAQLQLGKLWDRDVCDDFHLTIGLARLQMEIWRVNSALRPEHFRKSTNSVLLSTELNEPHRLGLTMSSEVFERGGWDVMCQSPGNEQDLNNLVRSQWFDVLALSQSGALSRDSRLHSIRGTIDGARAASMNPALIVIVDGRTFVERPQMYRAVHANGMCASALDALPNAERLLALSRGATAACVQTPA